ncbi:TPA: hypothetical protein ACW5EP_004820, partial [Salmonella enterica]
KIRNAPWCHAHQGAFRHFFSAGSLLLHHGPFLLYKDDEHSMFRASRTVDLETFLSAWSVPRI